MSQGALDALIDRKEWNDYFYSKGYVIFRDPGAIGIGRLCIGKNHPLYKDDIKFRGNVGIMDYIKNYPYGDLYATVIHNQFLTTALRGPNSRSTSKCECMPLSSSFPLGKCTIRDRVYPCLKTPETQLIGCYGKDYMTPKSGSNFTDQKKRRLLQIDSHFEHDANSTTLQVD